MCEQISLLAGFGKVDITPDYPTGLGGYSNAESRQHTGIADRIYTTCVALTEGEDTILLFTFDGCACDQGVAEKIRAAVTPITGIPGEKIFCSATHTHSAPALWGYPNMRRYYGDLLLACVEAARQALADQAPAVQCAAKQEVPGMNFVRHSSIKKLIIYLPFSSFKKQNSVSTSTSDSTNTGETPRSSAISLIVFASLRTQ